MNELKISQLTPLKEIVRRGPTSETEISRQVCKVPTVSDPVNFDETDI